MMPPPVEPLRPRLVAEAIGTFALVFIGCGAIMVDAEHESLGQLGIALAFGIVVMAMIAALGHVSGAHLNPAVTLAFVLARHFPAQRVPAYWAAQVAGAVAAAFVLRASLGDVADVGATVPSGSDGQSFLWETVLTFFLVLVIISVATDTRAVGETAALAIGGAVAFDALVGGPISGGSMNQARSLGPALASGTYDGLWIYLTAPFLGAMAGVLSYSAVRGRVIPAARA
jgi:MIP family channel proteins